MGITNRQGLPEVLERIAADDRNEHRPSRDVYSVTELLKPVREIVLSRRHYDEIEIDVADCVTAMLGTAVHGLFERNDDGPYTEYPVRTEVAGVEIRGRIDRLDPEAGTVEDYKTCSVSKVAKSDFADWDRQGLMYAWLVWRDMEIKIKRLRFYAIIKDWSKVQASTRSEYPQSPVYVHERTVTDSDLDAIEGWVYGRIAAIREAESGELPECTLDERWNTGDRWAVKKNASDKRALVLCENEDEAHKAITERCGGAGVIEFRPGDDLKCRLFCPCRKFCGKGGRQ